jgi:RNA polymerase sigma factor (sigma-70 family)
MFMRDSEIVAAIVSGNPAGLAEAYDKYAAALYAYCRTLLREPADAADTVQDTFIIAASSLSALRDPERLRPWLYAVARNECHRHWRGGHIQALLEETLEVSDDSADVELDAERADLRAMVSAALGGVGPAEREVLELQLRYGLEGGEVAAVLGITRNHAHALLSRARDQIHTALGVLLVARSGRRDCRELEALLVGWDGKLTVPVRKRVNRHIQRCDICSAQRRSELAPATLLSLVPSIGLSAAAVRLPPGLREQLLHGAGNGVPHSIALSRGGFPRPFHPLRSGWLHARPVHVGAAVAGAAGLTVTLTVAATMPRHAPPRSAAPDVRSVRSVAAAERTAADPRPSRTSNASPTAGATEQGTSGADKATATATPSPSAATGTLLISPTTLDITSSASGTITLTASGGQVSWTVSEPPGLTKKLVVSPMSGTLAVGATGTVTVMMEGPGKPHVHLVFNPGDTTVTVVVS